jgi:hypothetical protein
LDPLVPVSAAVASGDRLQSLRAIRDKLGELLDDADAKSAPALAQRLVAVMAEIDSLAASGEGSKLDRLRDDLAAKRAGRQAAAGP